METRTDENLNESSIGQHKHGYESKPSWTWFPISWSQTSLSHLQEAESNILKIVKSPYKLHNVNIGLVKGVEAHIWTLSIIRNLNETPIVLIHGLGSGLALWAMNFDLLSKSRSVYAFDLLGFGRSSRVKLSDYAQEAEEEWVQSIESWRREMQIEKFILVGHSLGGYLGTSYAIKYPQRVKHLVLADPWGFKKRPNDIRDIGRIPFHHRIIVKVVEPFNPLWTIRLAGPFGQKLIRSIRADLISKFDLILEESYTKVPSYIYHCNVQDPTGEAAFHAMMATFGWSKNPMINRIKNLKESVPLTLIYGGKSWVDHVPPNEFQELRGNGYFESHIIKNSGHHVYADNKEEFTKIVLSVTS